MARQSPGTTGWGLGEEAASEGPAHLHVCRRGAKQRQSDPELFGFRETQRMGGIAQVASASPAPGTPVLPPSPSSNSQIVCFSFFLFWLRSRTASFASLQGTSGCISRRIPIRLTLKQFARASYRHASVFHLP